MGGVKRRGLGVVSLNAITFGFVENEKPTIMPQMPFIAG